MGRVNCFLVFEGRAGSGLLRSIANTSPKVVLEAEWMLFNLRNEPSAAVRQIQRACEFFEDPKYRDLDALGFANKLSDIEDAPSFTSTLGSFEARLISLKRYNIVKQVVSSLNAIRTREKTGKSHAYSATEILTKPFELDLEQFDAHLERLVLRTDRLDTLVRDYSGPSIALYYEDLVQQKNQEIKRLADFLSTPYELMQLEPANGPLKQTPGYLGDILTNFDALRARYSGTRFEEMINDAGL